MAILHSKNSENNVSMPLYPYPSLLFGGKTDLKFWGKIHAQNNGCPFSLKNLMIYP